MEADKVTALPVSHDTEWLARNPRLDASLTAAIRAPVADERFDERVWSLIRTDEARAIAMQQALHMRLGTPWWLASLNVIAIAVTIVTVALALAGAGGPLTEAAVARWAVGDQPWDALPLFALLASAAGIWLGLRGVPFVRPFGSSWP
jgi:hypothetical protein